MAGAFKNLITNLTGDKIPGMGVASGAAGVATGLFKTVGSLFGGGKRRREQRRAQNEFNKLKQEYTDLDTSNLMLGQQNMYEDLTVNQQEAKFLGEQQQQGLSNALNANRAAAGGSGITALAQAMAKEAGPEGIHVGHVVVDGLINGDRVKERFPDFVKTLGEEGMINIESIVDAYEFLYKQPKTGWTFEVDLRTALENW